MSFRLRTCLLALFTTAIVRPASADTAPDPTAAALFRRGRELVESGDWDKGCEQFRASLARYEAASTALNMARCEEHFGRVASAWALFQRGLVLAHGEPGAERREGLERVAREGIAATETRLPKLKITIASPPAGFDLHESGRPLPIGEAVPLDPGAHIVVAEAPGYERFERRVQLDEGKTTELEVVLEPVVQTADRQPKPKEEPKKIAPPAPKKPAEPAPAETGVPTWAWISGGAGVLFAGIATGFALDARAQENALRDKCGGDFVCNEDPNFDPGPTNARKNRSLGLAIGFGSAGVIALGASVFGIVTAPHATRGGLRPNVAVSSRGVWLGAELGL